MELSSDRRLVRTFAATLSTLLEQRYRATGMLLGEPGTRQLLTSEPAETPKQM